MPSKKKSSVDDAKNGAESSSPQPEKFECWAVVEVMGHNTFAGRVTEQAIGGASFVRVDVPAVEATRYYPAQAGFTKFLGAGSIYAITPCTEDVVRAVAAQRRVTPVSLVDLGARKALEAGDDVPY